jgi:2-phosphosulfolactate phosphatase
VEKKMSWWPRVDFLPHPAAARAADLRGATVVVCDVLRATTTMIAALSAGCPRIVPCATLTSARRLAAELRRRGEPCYLAGERRGLPMPGFDQGNSPLAFLKIPPRTIVLTTSNGTRALAAAAPSRCVLILSFLNLSAVGRHLASNPGKHLVLLAAGDLGQPSAEDQAGLGMLLACLHRHSPRPGAWEAGWSSSARSIFRRAQGVGRLPDFLASTTHGKALRKLGYAADVRYAGRLDTTRLIGHLTSQGVVVLKKLK